MAIRGRLEDLPAVEVLQFLSLSRKSGTLRIFDESKSKLVCLANGQLVFSGNQHKLPNVGEVLYHRGIIDNELSSDQQEAVRWSDEVTKMLEWRRSNDGARIGNAAPQTSLGKILVRRGKLSQADLDQALEPESMPDNLLEEVLINCGGLSHTAVRAIRKISSPDVSLYEALISAKGLTREEIQAAIACMSEETLADLLVYFGYVKKSEAMYSTEHLAAVRKQAQPAYRIGEYLIASGKVSQRQLEKALGAQLRNHKLMGEILVDQGVLTSHELHEAIGQVAELRASFSLLRPLSEALQSECGITLQEFAAARQEHQTSDKTLAEILLDTGKVTGDKLRKVFERLLADDLVDVMFWQEGGYEFLEGFALDDVVVQEPLQRLHDYSFDLNSLLLEAHYQADELQNSSLGYISPKTILEVVRPAAVELGSTEVSDSDLRLLCRVNGRRTLAQVCAVLPRDCLSYHRLMSRFIEHGWIRPLSRMDAYNRGQASANRGATEQAILFYEHAMLATGEQPTDSTLRVAIQDARTSVSRSALVKTSYLIRKAMRVPLRGLIKIGFLARPCRWLRSLCSRIAQAWRPGLSRMSRALDAFMIQKELTRQWWAIRTRLFHPLRRFTAVFTKHFAMPLLIGVTITIVMMVPGVPYLDLPAGLVRTDNSVLDGTSHAPATLRPTLASLTTGGPLDVLPAAAESSMFVVSRDGILRRLSLVDLGRESSFEWEIELGKHGDLLSSPTVHGDRVFVTNVRGGVFAVSTAGDRVWSKNLPRVERIQPTVVLSASSDEASDEAPDEAESKAIGLVVVARESVHVLDPEDGEALYELRTGNMILARPAAKSSRLYVGGVDNHVYCADWRGRALVWDTEVSDDVMSLALVGDHLVALIRGGKTMCLSTKDGQVLWQKTMKENPVRQVTDVGCGLIALETASGLLDICDVALGETRMQVRANPAIGVRRLSIVGNRILYLSRAGYVGQLSQKGYHLWRSKDILGHPTGLVSANDHLAVPTREGTLWLFSLLDDTGRQGSPHR